jgi:YggT family protein
VISEPLFYIIGELLNLFWWAVILAALFSTLTSFGVLDGRNRIVYTIGDFLFRVTDPALRPIRRILPSFGNIDLSPLALLLLIRGAQIMLEYVHVAIRTGLQGVVL